MEKLLESLKKSRINDHEMHNQPKSNSSYKNDRASQPNNGDGMRSNVDIQEDNIEETKHEEFEEEIKMSEFWEASESGSDYNFGKESYNYEENKTENLRDNFEENKSYQSLPEARRLSKRIKKRRARRSGKTENSKGISFLSILNALEDKYFGGTMTRPYITPQGNTYEESKIRSYIRIHGKDPLSGEDLREEDLKKNEELFDLIYAKLSKSSHTSSVSSYSIRTGELNSNAF